MNKMTNNLVKIFCVMMILLLTVNLISARALSFVNKPTRFLVIEAVELASLDIKVFLEGALPTGSQTMDTALRDVDFGGASLETGVLPRTDPYLGTTTVSGTFHQDVVDWVLVELYTSNQGKRVYSSPAFLMSNGQIKDTTGTNNIYLNIDTTKSYYLVVKHRNHLAVVSASTVGFSSGVMTHDFTLGDSYNNDLGQIDLGNGNFAMISGDEDSNLFIQTNDKSGIWNPEVGRFGYLASDYDLNAFSQTTDKSAFWEKNVGKATQIPRKLELTI